MTSRQVGPDVCGTRSLTVSGRLLVWILLTALAAGCLNSSQRAGDTVADTPGPDPDILAFFETLATDPGVRFETDHGEIEMLVYQSLMPQTATRFLELVDQGFYDNTIVHRVVDDFVIQGGDPSGSGWLGSGQTIPFESHPHLPFVTGSVGLARDVDPDSGDSQWFIAEKPQPHLTRPTGATGTVFGTYAMYAQAVAGIDVVQSIAGVATVPGADRPIEDVMLQRATVIPPPATNLLTLPQTLHSTTGPAFTIDLSHPLYTFGNHSTPITVVVEPADTNTPLPTAISMAFTHSGGNEIQFTVNATERDAAVFMHDIQLPRSGTWHYQAQVQQDTIEGSLVAYAFHPAYNQFDRRGAEGDTS